MNNRCLIFQFVSTKTLLTVCCKVTWSACRFYSVAMKHVSIKSHVFRSTCRAIINEFFPAPESHLYMLYKDKSEFWTHPIYPKLYLISQQLISVTKLASFCKNHIPNIPKRVWTFSNTVLINVYVYMRLQVTSWISYTILLWFTFIFKCQTSFVFVSFNIPTHTQ